MATNGKPTSKKQTVADLEAITGKPDSIRNPKNQRNARSDKHIDTLKKELLAILPHLTLPDTMPESIEIKYAGYSGHSVGERLKRQCAVLNAFGLL